MSSSSEDDLDRRAQELKDIWADRKEENVDSIIDQAAAIFRGTERERQYKKDPSLRTADLRATLKKQEQDRKAAESRREKKRQEPKKQIITAMTHNEIVSACRLWLKEHRPDIIKQAQGISFKVGPLRAEIWKKKDG